MKINDNNYPLIDIFPTMMTVPDCVVKDSNKIGKGHGESKFYICSKKEMEEFYNFNSKNNEARCFMLKKDLYSYLEAAQEEYHNPSQNYRKKEFFPTLWERRMQLVDRQSDIIEFKIYNQQQINGTRGYVNSNDDGYQLLRELALPLISYICVQKLGNEENPIFYWRLFVDFEAIWEKENVPLVFRYGQTKASSEKKYKTTRAQDYNNARLGQGKYREKLLEQCPYCPLSRISDDRLLIASHIKPWAASNKFEKVDPYNGFMFSPLYDKLFDKGYITFTDDKRVILSAIISKSTWKKINIKNNEYIELLPMDEKRKEYLKFHREKVFKGNIEDQN